jgi:hypothetical protein
MIMKNAKKAYLAVLWIFIYLLLADAAVNIVFRFPEDPRITTASKLTRFFEYGRSAEGKLARLTKEAPEESASILTWGWVLEPEIRYFSKTRDSAARPTITVYGMSHSVLLAEDLAKIDDSFVVRSCGAPGAVPPWVYATYFSDKKRLHSDVVVFAIMTRGVPLTCTTSGTTNNFDTVLPYTYPRFFHADGILTSIDPPFLSLGGYREHFFDKEKWASYEEWLRQNDKYYDPLLFQKSVLDRSSIVRMLRRAYAYSSQRKQDARVYDIRDGFDPRSEELEILKSLIVSFAEDAKQNHSLPIVYIVNNVFMGDHLYRALEPTLAAGEIPFISSHEICPPDDPTLFEANSHFVPARNILLAKAMMELIKANLTVR